MFKFRMGQTCGYTTHSTTKIVKIVFGAAQCERESERDRERGLIHKLKNASDSNGVGKL